MADKDDDKGRDSPRDKDKDKDKDKDLAANDKAANEAAIRDPAGARRAMMMQNQPQQQSGDMINVTCRLPHGLTLRLYDMVPGDDGKQVPIPREEEYTVAGANSSQLYTGFGITPVPRDFWERWAQVNQRLPALRNGLLFAEPKLDKAIDHARENADVRTGTEALNPSRPGPGLQPATAADIAAEGGRRR